MEVHCVTEKLLLNCLAYGAGDAGYILIWCCSRLQSISAYLSVSTQPSDSQPLNNYSLKLF